MPEKAHDIQTTVSFAASEKPTFKRKYPPTAAVQTVLADAEGYYEVTTDGTTRYYLFFDGAEITPGLALADLDGGHGHDVGNPEHQLKLALRTETISG